MADIDHIEPSVCAMVRHVNHTHNAFIVQFTNGNMATVETEDPLPIIGDVILLSDGGILAPTRNNQHYRR